MKADSIFRDLAIMSKKIFTASLWFHVKEILENGFLIWRFLILFLPISLLIYFNPFIKNRSFRNIWLFLVSVFFYA